MVVIEKGNLKVTIDEMGAEIKSVLKNGQEYMWQGYKEIWNCTAPVMFPICGGLKDDRYVLDGKEYFMPKHGFAKNSLFAVESVEDDSAVFLLKSTQETKKNFPFDFQLRIIYTLEENSVAISYKVSNVGENTMYFSIGSHEGYATPEGIEDYDVIFEKKETLNSVLVDGNLLQKFTLPIIKDTNVLPLYDKYFIVDALVFTDIKSKSASLRNRKTGREIRIDFPDATYFVIWHKHGAPYICLEPWSGIPDYQDADGDITKKVGITALGAGETYCATHTINIVNEG